MQQYLYTILTSILCVFRRTTAGARGARQTTTTRFASDVESIYELYYGGGGGAASPPLSVECSPRGIGERARQDRAALHMLAEKLGFVHKSREQGELRRLVVTKSPDAGVSDSACSEKR